MADEDSSEKPFEATPRKLEEARKRGEHPVSQDLVTFSVYLGFLVVVSALGAWSMNALGVTLMQFLAMPDHLSERVFKDNGSFWLNTYTKNISVSLLYWFLIPVIFAVVTSFVQGALVFSGQKIQPKLNRISPIKNAKQKYGKDGLFNFIKSFAKLMIYSFILYFVFIRNTDLILSMPSISLPESLKNMAYLCTYFLSVSAAVMLMISGIDFFWQRSQFLARQRMSLKELKDELKETEGDPYAKQARRQRAQDIATNQMLSDVPDADVVIVNPQHFAVALKWSRLRGTAPVCVAKGTDEIAFRIREVATEHAVPIFRDPPTARALFATVEIGNEVTVDLYQAVAAAIRFSDAMRMKARGGR